MRVVLVAQAFPPHRAVGALRAGKIAEAFRKAGHEVDVVTERCPEDAGGGRPTMDGIRVYPVRMWPHPLTLYGKLPAFLKKKPSIQKSSSSEEMVRTTDPGRPRRSGLLGMFLSLLWVPDGYQGFSVPAGVPALWRCLRGADLLYTTGPPHSSHVMANVIRRLTGIPWVAEFRDPWMGSWHWPDGPHPDLGTRINRRLERRVLRLADRVVVVTEGVQRKYMGMLVEDDRDRVVLARNGIDRIEPGVAPDQPGPIRISHIGSLSWYRTPVPFLEALARLRDAGHLPERGVQVRFVGLISDDLRRDFDATIEDHALHDLVQLVPPLPHEEAGEVARNSHALLLIAPHQPIQIPNKLYEYLGTRRPILGIVDEEGESAQLLRSAGGSTLVYGNDVDAIEPGLAEILSRIDGAPVQGPDGAFLEDLRSEGIFRDLIDSLDPEALRSERRGRA